MIEFRRDALRRDGRVVLRAVALGIAAGERVVVLGASGAGKTTLLNALYADIAPHAALIPQPHGLVGPLSARQNIALGRIDQRSLWANLRSLCWMSAREQADIDAWATRLDLVPQIAQRVDTLSGGQQSRVAIGRALHRGGPLLLADEPCAALDPERAARALACMRTSFSTLVCTMHDVDAGMALATRIVGLAGGRIAIDTRPDDISREQLDLLYAQQEASKASAPPVAAQDLPRPCI